jgi:putative hydrolase of the HAD superfamily
VEAEECGALKPNPKPFAELCRRLGVEAEAVLYVGNSVRNDVEGAHRAGMATALRVSAVAGSKKKNAGADFVFRDYRELAKFAAKPVPEKSGGE